MIGLLLFHQVLLIIRALQAVQANSRVLTQNCFIKGQFDASYGLVNREVDLGSLAITCSPPAKSECMTQVAVIGGGPAGLMAAAAAAERSARVVLLEKNSKIGVKILMSGGTRCNLTQHTDARGITAAFGHARRFLQPSVGAFPPAATVAMFNQLGVATKIEATGKIFPQSDRAVEVRDALLRRAVAAGAEIRLRCGVNQIHRVGSVWELETSDGPLQADRLIVAAGGRSWPGCGTTGDAYAWLTAFGHTVVPTRPALVPLTGGEPWMRELSGLTLPDTSATVRHADLPVGKKSILLQRRGSWLFTHFGFSGPAAMDVSGTLTAAPSLRSVRLELDLLPDLAAVDLDRQLADRDAVQGGRTVAARLGEWLPQRLATLIAQHAQAAGPVAELTRQARDRLVRHVKQLPIPVDGTRGFAKAEVTAGGVKLAEVDRRTMQSKLIADLYICGEVLDVDGWIGGYNFQAAFSTGRAAGIAAAGLHPHTDPQ